MILEEFDTNQEAILNPCNFVSKIDDVPKIGITCFSKKIIDRFVEKYNPEIVTYLGNANGKQPIYKINYNNAPIIVFMSYTGAPSCVALYEEIFEIGVEKLIVFGTCGVLDKKIEDLSIIIPTSAIRDEGTSYHYVKGNREIVTNLKYKEEFIDVLKENNCSYTLGKVWTTDAIYRETKEKVKKRKEEGCICVDMEASAISALASFRKKDIFQFFYAADNLDNEKWDRRSLGCDERLDEKAQVLELALQLAGKIN